MTAQPVSLSAVSLASLVGMGPKSLALLREMGISTAFDLLFHLPLRYEDRTCLTPMSRLVDGQRVMVEGTVSSVQVIRHRRSQLLVKLTEGAASLTLKFFHFNGKQVSVLQQEDFRLRCFGEVRQAYRGGFEMVHPEYRSVEQVGDLVLTDYLTPIYPTVKGMGQVAWRKWMAQILHYLQQASTVFELLPVALQSACGEMSLRQALMTVHHPAPSDDVSALLAGSHPAQIRLLFEECLAHQLALLRRHQKQQQYAAVALPAPQALLTRFETALPFTLTAAQVRVNAEISADLARARPMMRLVQGDVGSGKTVVAAWAILHAVGHGCQVALMAPTELLAQQHLTTLSQWLQPLGISVALLLGKQSAAERRDILSALQTGQLSVVVGTQALFQAAVEFNSLALIIIDEQHRFGVRQRFALQQKGMSDEQRPHQLVMTATPIPRTLAMWTYGDLAASVIDELPPGRQPITTVLIANDRRDQVIERVRVAIRQGAQVYWVCTLIEESEVLQCQAAEEAANLLQASLSEGSVGLLHGRLASTDKTERMQAFKAGAIDCLVATTVVEVGVDVPNATVMVIENPERLGLAQLHQLRGRIGRGSKASYCVLMYQAPLGYTAQNRLRVMQQTQDGFKIAQQDLMLRGPGEILGAQQSGVMIMRCSQQWSDPQWMAQVSQLARRIIVDFPDHVEPLIQRWLAQQEALAGV